MCLKRHQAYCAGVKALMDTIFIITGHALAHSDSCNHSTCLLVPVSTSTIPDYLSFQSRIHALKGQGAGL